MKRNILVAMLCVLTALSCMSCDSSKSVSPESSTVIGAWGSRGYDPETGIHTYAKLDSLCGDQIGYAFEPDGVLWYRSPGWCGTPPLTYGNYAGTWTTETTNRLILALEMWDGIRSIQFEILHIDKDELHARSTPID